jgi:hypothetical protein
MLNLITPADAAQARMRSCMGTGLAGGGTPVPGELADRLAVQLPVPWCAQGIAMPFARPRAHKAVYLLGYRAKAAGQVELARQQRTSNVQNAHTTRIAARISAVRFSAKGGGPLGPHPARDPV